jgi:hypothetical protein
MREDVIPEGEPEERADSAAVHPSGVRHVCASAVSVFAFDLYEKLGMAMSEIHSANVPGWALQVSAAGWLSHAVTAGSRGSQ